MNWYKCDECGKVFTEHDIVEIEIQSGDFWGTPYTEKGCASPCCESSFTKGNSCKVCGEYTDIGKEYCRECKKSVKSKFADFLITLSNTETDIFSEVVFEFADGEAYMGGQTT